MLYSLAFMLLILVATLGNMLLGFGTALVFGHGPKWMTDYLATDQFRVRLRPKRSQKSPQSPH